MAEEDKVYKGSCFCGAVNIEAKGKTIFRVRCHCTICQRLSGAENTCLVGFPTENLKVTKGEDNLNKYFSSEAMERVFCKTCASNVYSHSHIKEMPFRDAPVTIFTRDEREKLVDLKDLEPEVHIFYRSRVRDYKDGLKKYSGLFDEVVEE